MFRDVYKNWFVHNMFSHPLMALIGMLPGSYVSELTVWIHDVTLPEG